MQRVNAQLALAPRAVVTHTLPVAVKVWVVQIANLPDVHRYLQHHILDLRAILALRQHSNKERDDTRKN
jgi:hypothetical protein